MDTARWRTVERLYHSALERRHPRERAAFLDTECGSDAALRADVESLLAHDPDGSSFMETPAVAHLGGVVPGAASRAGSRLGPYQLGALVGAGGMGEVYKAADTRLGRDVAIKVLPAFWSSDPDRRARLEREARAIAAVTHPNICALYDVGRDGDVEFLVLEYVEGETLADRLLRGALPLDEALRVAMQIASALAAAHARGIVHRDLKPANVVLTRAGAKLLDFGLAKLGEPSGASSLTQPTAAASLTAVGMILGTLQYMSPEQVEGHDADARSDIFAFGALLHEMISGAKAFQGKTQASLIAAILEREPVPLPQLRPETPPALARIVRTCLAKDPAQRWQSAVDLDRELAWVREDLGSGAIAVPVRPARGRLQLLVPWSIAAIVVAVAASVVWRERAVQPHQGSPMHLNLDVPPELASRARFPAISPDARYVTFVDYQPDRPEDTRIWIHDLRASETHSVDGTAGAEFPFWSPDGNSIAFFAKGALRRLDTKTGSIQTLCDAPGGRGGTWGPDDTIVFSPDLSAPLMRISAQGAGKPTAVTKLEPAQDRGHRLPFFLDDGRHFIFTRIKSTGAKGLAIGSVDAADPVDIVDGPDLDTQGEVAAGKFIYVREGALVAQDFDMKTLAPRGERVPLVRRIANDGLSRAAFSSSSDGTVVYRSAAQESAELAILSRSGAQILALGQAPGPYTELRVSPDGRKLAVARLDASTDVGGIWVMDPHDGRETFVTQGADAGAPVWTPDGTRIVYQYMKAWAVFNVHATDLESGRDELVIDTDRPGLTPYVALPDGTVLYGQTGRTGATSQLWRSKRGTAEPGDLIDTAPDPFDVRLSPDGRWLSYTSVVSGLSEIFVQGYPSGPRHQITSGGAGQAQWRADGKELYYLTDGGTKLHAAPVMSSTALRVGPAPVLFGVPPGSSYAPAPDGRTFYVALRQPPTKPRMLKVLVNWLRK